MIQLLLKSPNQQVDDVKVECDSQWTVENLKDYLCNAYPTKPPKNQQKIIYGGRLLPDHLLIKDIVTRDHDVHIMHLVCPQSTYASKTPAETSKTKESHEEIANVGPSPLPNIFGDTINTDGLRQRVFDPQQYMSNLSNMYSQAQLQPQASAVPVASMYNAYQLATLQQTYAQFMAQFLAQGQHSYQMPNPGITVPNQPSVQPNFNPPAANLHRPNENEDRRERFDLIDSLYVVTRLAMLFVVLYFYSSPGRILVVLSVVTLFLLYRVGPRRRQPEVLVASTTPNTTPQPQNANSENTTEQTENQSEENSEPDTDENQPSKLETIFVFVKTLFTSLIPDQPLPVDVN